MKNIMIFLKTYFPSIFLLICGTILLLNNKSSHSETGIIFFSLFVLVALAQFLSNQFPKKEHLIWIVFNILFAAGMFYQMGSDFLHNSAQQKQVVETGQEDTSIETRTVIPKQMTQKRGTALRAHTTPQQDLPTDLGQRIVDILKGEDFTKIMDEGIKTGRMPEPLTSFSKFQKYLVSQGLTEIENLDIENTFQDAFQERFPGKVPSDLDTEMKQKFVLAIREFGYEKAQEEFLKTSEHAIWLSARFDPVPDMGKALGKWPERLIADDFGDRTINEILGLPSPEPRQLELSPTETKAYSLHLFSLS